MTPVETLLAGSTALTPAADLEPSLRTSDLEKVLSCSRRQVQRMRSGGRLPAPDLHVGRRSPRWSAETVRCGIGKGGRR